MTKKNLIFESNPKSQKHVLAPGTRGSSPERRMFIENDEQLPLPALFFKSFRINSINSRFYLYYAFTLPLTWLYTLVQRL